jgi:mRNA-degrading endonuclease RelE of RelBE toxin-antitoxin system
MQWRLCFTPNSDADLKHYRAFDQRSIVDAIKVHLAFDANIETNRRKRLAEHPIAAWELRAGKYRVFYELEGEAAVKIVAIGHKEHNSLFIRGKEVEL